MQALRVTQSLIRWSSSLSDFLPPPRVFFPEPHWGVWRWVWSGPLVWGKAGGGPGSHEQAAVLPSLLCQQFLLPAAKVAEVGAGQIQVSLLWLHHVSEDFPEDPASLCLRWPCGPPSNLLATNLIFSSDLPCCFLFLGHLTSPACQHY